MFQKLMCKWKCGCIILYKKYVAWEMLTLWLFSDTLSTSYEFPGTERKVELPKEYFDWKCVDWFPVLLCSITSFNWQRHCWSANMASPCLSNIAWHLGILASLASVMNEESVRDPFRRDQPNRPWSEPFQQLRPQRVSIQVLWQAPCNFLIVFCFCVALLHAVFCPCSIAALSLYGSATV